MKQVFPHAYPRELISFIFDQWKDPLPTERLGVAGIEGGCSALSLKLADFDALVITGKAKSPSALIVGARQIDIKDVHYLWGTDLQVAGKVLQRTFPGAGHSLACWKSPRS